MFQSRSVCLSSQTQAQSQAGEHNQGHAPMVKEGLYVPPSPSDTSVSISSCVPPGGQHSWCLPGWCSAGPAARGSSHHIVLLLERGRREASTARCREEEELTGPLLFIISRDLCNGLNWIETHSVSHQGTLTSEHIYYASYVEYTKFHFKQEILGSVLLV